MTTRVPMRDAVETLLPRLREIRLTKPAEAPVFVAIVGGSASGKGHLIARLRDALNGPGAPPDSAAVLPLDNYYLGAAERRLRGAPHFDHPAAVDLAQAHDDLAKMAVAKTLRVPKYDFSCGERAGYEPFTAKRFVLIDGLFALHAPEIRALADLSVFIDSDHYSSMLRRLFRDPGPGGRTKQSSREVLKQYFTQVWPAKREFIDPTAAYADVIVESRYDAATEAVRAGPVQYQLKACAPQLSDEAVTFLSGAARLGGEIRQVDRFLSQRDAPAQGDILRLRMEPDANDDVLLTYKGPLMSGDAATDAAGRPRPASSSIALPREALKWFQDAYDVAATIEKRRVLYQIGSVTIARDRVKQLGNFIEARGVSDDSPREDAALLHRMKNVLAALCPDQTPTDASYLDLWRARAPLSVRP